MIEPLRYLLAQSRGDLAGVGALRRHDADVGEVAAETGEIQATPDDPKKMTIAFRRDSFCGKMSACNNLRQYGIPYSITTLHTESPDSPEFARDLQWFAGVCRVVNCFRNLRVGAIGARPTAFNTVRYSEKLLEASGITTETVDLSEILGRIARLKDDDSGVQGKLAEIRKYVTTGGVPDAALIKMSKLGYVIDQWMKQTDVKVSAVQCWTAMEEYFGVVPCTIMSMMSNNLLPAACEVDVCGTLSMHALALASETPSALLDWNNNYGDDPDKAVCFHCSNLPKPFFQDVRMDFQEIIAGTVGKDNTFGTVVGRVKPGAMSFARFSTDDRAGTIRGYVGQGEFTDDALTVCPTCGGKLRKVFSPLSTVESMELLVEKLLAAELLKARDRRAVEPPRHRLPDRPAACPLPV